MMTLKEKVLAIPTRKELIGGQWYQYVRLEEVVAAIEANPPEIPDSSAQPQPVAQGEAVAWQCRGIMAGHFTEWQECEKEHYDKRTPLTGWGDNEIETEFRELYATPTIPTGHRVVPVEPTEDMLDAATVHDTEPRTPKVDDWNRITYQLMIAASPSAGGV